MTARTAAVFPGGETEPFITPAVRSVVMDAPSFCTACGAGLPPGAAVCPECGRAVPGAAVPQEDPMDGRITYSRPMDAEWGRWSNPSGASIIGVYGALASVLGLAFGLYLIFMSESMFETFKSFFEGLGLSFRFTYEEMPSYGYACLVMMVSGFFALGSYMVCRANKHWRPAVLLSAIAAVVPLATFAFGAMFGFYFFIIGAVVTFALYRIRNGFKDGGGRRARAVRSVRMEHTYSGNIFHPPRGHRLLTRAPIIRA